MLFKTLLQTSGGRLPLITSSPVNFTDVLPYISLIECLLRTASLLLTQFH